MSLLRSIAEYTQQRIYGPASGMLVIFGLLIGTIGTLGTYLSLNSETIPSWFLVMTAIYPALLTVWLVY